MTHSDNLGIFQNTLQREVRVSGVGLHSGRPVSLCLLPASADHGIAFLRTDLRSRPSLPARAEHILRSRLCTTLARGHATVATVEHLLAACYGLGIDNLLVEIDGPEVPILDGSSQPFVELLVAAGRAQLSAPRTFLRLRRPISVREGGRQIEARPGERLKLHCSVDFPHPLVRTQTCRFELGSQIFVRDIAPARTFGFLKDVEALRRAGLALGGSFENAVVFDRFLVLTPGGLRFQDECVRHKVLDLLGDLALLGHPLIAEIDAHKAGHALHHRLLRGLLDEPACFEFVQAGPGGTTVILPTSDVPWLAKAGSA